MSCLAEQADSARSATLMTGHSQITITLSSLWTRFRGSMESIPSRLAESTTGRILISWETSSREVYLHSNRLLPEIQAMEAVDTRLLNFCWAICSYPQI